MLIRRKTICSLITLTLSLALSASGVSKPTDKPNILVILADDMGYSDIGCMGGDAETPHLDALAKNGVLFTHFYNNAKCAPSRASLMSGQSPQRTGATHGAGDITRGGMTIAQALKGTYATLMVDKWHIKPEPLELGFQRNFGIGLSAVHWWPINPKDAAKMQIDGRPYTEKDMVVPVDEWFLPVEDTNYAIKFIQEEVIDKGKTKPFFMYYASHLPHWPAQAPRADIERYLEVFKEGTDVARQRRYDRMVQIGIIDPKTTPLSPLDSKLKRWSDMGKEEKSYYQQTLAIHAAMVHCLDREVGRLIDYLKKNDLFDNTAIFFLSDNGASAEGSYKPFPAGQRLGDRGTDGRILDEGAAVSNTPMRGNKSTLFEGGIGTPMIFHWPQGIGKPGTKTQQVGHLTDIFPTALEVAGVKYPSEYDGRKLNPLDGQSLLPQLKGGPVVDRTIFWDYEKFSAVRQGNWKALRLSAKGKNSSAGSWQLYDLSKDRSENKDVAKDNPEVLKSITQKWSKWYEDVSAEPPGQPEGKSKKDKSDKKDKKSKSAPAPDEEE